MPEENQARQNQPSPSTVAPSQAGGKAERSPHLDVSTESRSRPWLEVVKDLKLVRAAWRIGNLTPTIREIAHDLLCEVPALLVDVKYRPMPTMMMKGLTIHPAEMYEKIPTIENSSENKRRLFLEDAMMILTDVTEGRAKKDQPAWPGRTVPLAASRALEGQSDAECVLQSDDLKILKAMAKKPGVLLKQYDIEQIAKLSRGTIGKRLEAMRAAGLTHRPKGEQGGETLTEKGKVAAATGKSKPKKIAHRLRRF